MLEPFSRILATFSRILFNLCDFFMHFTSFWRPPHAFWRLFRPLDVILATVARMLATFSRIMHRVGTWGGLQCFNHTIKSRGLFFIGPHPKNSSFEPMWLGHKNPYRFYDVVWAVKAPTTPPHKK